MLPTDKHNDDHEMTAELFAKAKPAKQALAEIYGAELAEEFLNNNREHVAKRGRPKSNKTKVAVSIRIDEDVLNGYKKGGRGWQTLANAVLREGLERTRGKAKRAPATKIAAKVVRKLKSTKKGKKPA